MSLAIARSAVVVGVAVALLVPASQAAFGWGLTASEFSDQGDETLRAAGWAFSIWGLIYAGLAAFAIQQLRDGSEAMARARWPAAAAALGCGLWILAAGYDSRWLTVLIIAGSAVAAITAAAQLRGGAKARGLSYRLFALWPLSLLAGWLTIASLVNLLTVLTAEGLVPGGQRLAAGLAGVTLAAGIGAAVSLHARLAVYALPVVWGLIAVAAAAATDQRLLLAVGAAAAALAVAAVAGWRALAGRTHREP